MGFGDILSMGSGGQATSQKDMFKNFQMTPPAATAAAGNAGIDDYLMNSKGVVPVVVGLRPMSSRQLLFSITNNNTTTTTTTIICSSCAIYFFTFFVCLIITSYL